MCVLFACRCGFADLLVFVRVLLVCVFVGVCGRRVVFVRLWFDGFVDLGVCSRISD